MTLTFLQYKEFKQFLVEREQNLEIPSAETSKDFTHYGHAPNRTMLYGRMSGTGIKGAEQERLKLTNDSRIKKRVYFYPPVAGGYPKPEAGLGPHMYQANLDHFHDATKQSADSVKIAAKAKEHVEKGEHPFNAYEKAVLDSGFRGYRTEDMAVGLNHDVPVKYIGSKENHNLISIPVNTKEKKRSIIGSFPNTEGEHSSSPLNDHQAMFFIKNKATLKKAAPSVRMQYGRLYLHHSDVDNFNDELSKNHPDHPL